ncbi:MAG: hypothetical protein Q4P24_07010 [Rhodobacterales bacterium]|nr:hypothetical protein [Rhodobacterales bacterium]
MTNQTLHQIKLAPDRAAQIRNLAAQEGVSMNTAIGKLFRALYGHTDVPHDIPSIKINALADGLTVRVEDNETTGFSFETVAQIAQTLRAFLAGEHPGGRIVLACPTHGGTFAIWRRGTAFKIEIPAEAAEKNLTSDLLEDLAAILEHEIAKTKA